MRVISITIGMHTKPCIASPAFTAGNWELLCNTDLILLQKKAFSAQNITHTEKVCDRLVSDLLNLCNRAVTDLCIICYGNTYVNLSHICKQYVKEVCYRYVSRNINCSD